MRLTLNERAGADLEKIRVYIARDNPNAAKSVAKRFLSGLSLLANHPYIGRVGRLEETREFVFADLPYIGIYRVHSAEDLVEVLRIVHAARKYPPES